MYLYVLLTAAVGASLESEMITITEPEEKMAGGRREVVELTSTTFDLDVNDEHSGAWLINFYYPRCPHCLHLKPVLAAVAARGYAVGQVNCQIEGEFCRKLNIKGYPTVVLNKQNKMRTYIGRRTEQALVGFIEAGVDASPEQPGTHLPAGMWENIKVSLEVATEEVKEVFVSGAPIVKGVVVFTAFMIVFVLGAIGYMCFEARRPLDKNLKRD